MLFMLENTLYNRTELIGYILNRFSMHASSHRMQLNNLVLTFTQTIFLPDSPHIVVVVVWCVSDVHIVNKNDLAITQPVYNITIGHRPFSNQVMLVTNQCSH